MDHGVRGSSLMVLVSRGANPITLVLGRDTLRLRKGRDPLDEMLATPLCETQFNFRKSMSLSLLLSCAVFSDCRISCDK